MTGVTGAEPHGGGEAAAPGQPCVPAAMAWRSLRPRPTLRLRLTVLYGALFLAAGALLLPLSFLLFRQRLDNALRPPLPRGHSQPFPQLASPSPPSTRPHARRPGTTGQSSRFPTRAQLEVRDQAVHQL